MQEYEVRGIVNSKKKFRLYSKSLRMRLLIVMLIVGLIPILVLKYVILENYESQSVEQRVGQIRSQCAMIAEQISASDFLLGQGSQLANSELSQLSRMYSGRVMVINSNFRIVKDTYGIDEGKILMTPDVLRAFKNSGGESYDVNEEFLQATVPIYNNVSLEMIGAMIVSVPVQDIVEARARLSGTVNLLEIVLVLGVIFIAFYFSGKLVRPFGKVTSLLEEKGSFLDEDISIPDFTETELLTEAYNGMRRRLKTQEDSRQEFVSNVSHELKTPLTSMKVLADSLTSMGDVPNELYKEFMVDIGNEIDRENKIISDLLSLVKMDRKSSDINIKETNINELIDLILRRLRPIAGKTNIELVLEDYKPILAEVDETKLSLALTNLIENAIKYNKEGGWVHVSLNMDNSFFYVKVEDSGMGIPEDSQAFIFERFYRVDKSHSREIGGTGLGLAITKSAITMHHGAIRVYSKEGEGTTFTVRIPQKYVADIQNEVDTEQETPANVSADNRKPKLTRKERKEKKKQLKAAAKANKAAKQEAAKQAPKPVAEPVKPKPKLEDITDTLPDKEELMEAAKAAAANAAPQQENVVISPETGLPEYIEVSESDSENASENASVDPFDETTHGATDAVQEAITNATQEEAEGDKS